MYLFITFLKIHLFITESYIELQQYREKVYIKSAVSIQFVNTSRFRCF